MKPIEQNEKDFIEKVFIANDKIIFKAANSIDMDRNRFAYRLKKYGIAKRLKVVSDELHSNVVKALKAYNQDETILTTNPRGNGAMIKYFAFMYLYKHKFVELKAIAKRYNLVDIKIRHTMNKYEEMIASNKDVKGNFTKFCSLAEKK